MLGGYGWKLGCYLCSAPMHLVTSFNANLLMDFDGQAWVHLNPASSAAGANFLILFPDNIN